MARKILPEPRRWTAERTAGSTLDRTMSRWPVGLIVVAGVLMTACTDTQTAVSTPPRTDNQAGKGDATMREPTTEQRQETDRKETRKKALDLARKCAAAAPVKGLGVHGTALVYEKAEFDTPAEARARGETSRLAALDAEFILVAVPESPPMDARLPNGRRLLVNLKTGKCEVMSMR